MKEYQPKKNNRYELPQQIYMSAIYLVRDYDRLKIEYQNVACNSPHPPDGQPRGSNISNPTEKEGIVMAVLFEKMKAVEQAMICIPEEYREGVARNVMYRESCPEFAHRNTWSKYRCQFLYTVAENMRWI